jgi:hypothetical protein
MRKFAILLAATLMVSVPLSMTVVTDVYAASKKAKKHKRAKAAPKAAPAEAGVQPPFQAIYNATNDLGRQLATGGRR